MLICRRLCSKIPVSASFVRPHVCDKDTVNRLLTEKQVKAAIYHDRSSRPMRHFRLFDEVK